MTIVVGNHSKALSQHLTEQDAEELVNNFYEQWEPADRRSTFPNELASYCYEQGYQDCEVTK